MAGMCLQSQDFATMKHVDWKGLLMTFQSVHLLLKQGTQCGDTIGWNKHGFSWGSVTKHVGRACFQKKSNTKTHLAILN